MNELKGTKKYLVVSYDSDQQQWFYDTVLKAA